MNVKSLIPFAAAFCLAASAFGQSDTVRVAIANPGRIFNEMQETKALKANLESEHGRLKQMEDERRKELQKLQEERNQLKADTPQWEELNNKLMDAVLEFQLWGQKTKAKAERDQKRQLKLLFDNIESAVAEVAKRDGYDLVVAELRPELPENLDQVTFDQMRIAMNSRNVLYASSKADISDAVIAMLDSKYKSKGGGAVAAPGGRKPAPAPAPAPASAPAPRKQ
jgi:Skp family chaperone for outer membrane proteins